MDEKANELSSFELDMINRFKWHTPKNEATANAHGAIRDECLRMSSYLAKYVPPGRELSLALIHLEEVMMWANAGIARA